MSFDKVILIHNALIIPGKLHALSNQFQPSNKTNQFNMLYKFVVLTYSKSVKIYQDQYNFLDFSLEICLKNHNIIKKICESKTEALLQIKNEIEPIAKIAEVKLKDFPDKNIFMIELEDANLVVDFKSLFDKITFNDIIDNI
jgi:hypothetical protein